MLRLDARSLQKSLAPTVKRVESLKRSGVGRQAPLREAPPTPRSSGAPTAGHQARSVVRSIFHSPGLAACRRRPLSSTTRASPPLSNRSPPWLIAPAIDHGMSSVFALPHHCAFVCRCLLSQRHVDSETTNSRLCKFFSRTLIENTCARSFICSARFITFLFC